MGLRPSTARRRETQVARAYAAWSETPVVRFYANERSRLEDLYESERAILMPALSGCRSLLDVGCAAGGFYEMVRRLRPGIRYAGVDAAAGMIAQARHRYPRVSFEVSDGRPLPFPDGAFDLALCTSVLHHNPDYREMIRELYRVAARGCVIDLPRLVSVPYAFDLSHSHMALAQHFDPSTQAPVCLDAARDRLAGGRSLGMSPETRRDERGAATATVPYVLSDARSMFEWLLTGLEPHPRALAAVGYYGQPNPSVTVPVSPVCFCVVYLGKGSASEARTRAFLELPQDIEAHVPADRITRLPGGRDVIQELVGHA